MMMKTVYEIVDVDGDSISVEAFGQNRQLHVRLVAIRFEMRDMGEGDELVLIQTLEYLHGEDPPRSVRDTPWTPDPDWIKK